MFYTAEMTAWLVGGVIECVLLLYLLWSLFGDRSKGRKRCPSCAHPFGDLSGTRCPECGNDAQEERNLYATRRHWARAFTAIVLMFSIAVVIRMRAIEFNAMSLIPDKSLIWLLNFENTKTPGPFSEEIKWRLMFDDLSSSAKDTLLNYLIAGDKHALPGSQAWANHYGMLAEVMSDSMDIHGHQDLPKLLQLPPIISLSAPAQWPTDIDIPAQISIDEFWPYGTDGKVDIKWPHAHTNPTLATICFRNYSAGQRPFPFTLPPLASWPKDEPPYLEVIINTRKPSGNWDSQQLRTSEVTWSEWSAPRSFMIPLPQPIVTDVNLHPIDTPELDAIIQRVFRPGLRKWEGTERPFAIRFDIRTISRAPSDISFGVFAEIIERTPDGEDHVRRRSKLWMTNTADSGIRSGWGISEEDSQSLSNAFDPESKSDWRMRITGNKDLALRGVAQASGDVGRISSWWNGSVEFPLPTHRERDAAFTRRWFLQDGPPAP